MVLKRKLPTQESKKDKVVETEKHFDDFDMSIETDNKVEKPAKKAHDLNDDFPDQIEDKPEDFIPEELRVLETENPVIEDETTKAENIKPAEEVLDDQALKQEQETQEIAPVSFDEPEEDFSMNLDDEPVVTQPEDNFIVEEPANPFEQTDAAPAELPTSQDFSAETPAVVEESFEQPEEIIEEPIAVEQPVEEPVEIPEVSFDAPVAEEPAVDFENQEHANWKEVVDNSEHKDENFDSFESISWENTDTVAVKTEVKDDRFDQDEPTLQNDDPFASDNGGIVPEIPGLDDDFSGPAEVMGQNSQDLTLNSDAKRKLIAGGAVAVLAVGALFAYSNMDKTTEVANRWSGSLTEANQDIAETKEEEKELIDDGVDITQAEEVIDFSELSDESSDNETTEVADVKEQTDPETEINLLEPENIETTASGKEVIKATGDEEIPEDVEQGANLITNIAAEMEKQKAEKEGLDSLEKEESSEEVEGEDIDAADMNKRVDDQLAQYRKLLAQEEDPGKKVKPGKFFSGKYKHDEEAAPTARSVNVEKVDLSAKDASAHPENYVVTGQQIEGHKIVEYPKGKARQPDDGIRQLDHFRNLIVEKEDKRVRMPKHVKPGLRNQGFPKFKVISIVPNYGLIGEYNDKKGILMIGDSFQGWELIGVYESYAEFKTDSRKHIISLN